MSSALRLDVVPSLGSPTLLLAFDGWNDAGEAASAAVRFIDDALNSTPLGEIGGEEFFDFTIQRPQVSLDAVGARRIEWPAYRFRYAVLEGRCELVTGVGPEPHLHWRSFCADVLALARKLRVRRVVLLGAFLAEVLYSRPVRVSGFGEPRAQLDALGVGPTGYEGPTGIVGVLASLLAEEGVETLSLWAALPHYITLAPNPRGTLALMQKTTQLLDLPVDLGPLVREAAEFEEQASKLVSADPALSEYVRELKKREFAQ